MKFPTVLSLFIWCFPVTASFAEAERKTTNGKVIAASVTGDVQAVREGSKTPLQLKTKDVISENHTVRAGTASAATLVFSNGATINLQQKSALVISEFLQDPFTTPFVMEMETEEPTVSTTKLDLLEGEVVCKVKKLNTDKGSSLTVSTPVGAAGIRGTTFAISYDPNSEGAGMGKYVLSVTEGVVSLTDINGNVTLIKAGQEIEITFKSKVDELTGEVTVVEIISREIRDIPPGRLDMINRMADKGEVNADLVIFDLSDKALLGVLPISGWLPAVTNSPPSVTEVNPPSNFETEE